MTATTRPLGNSSNWPEGGVAAADAKLTAQSRAGGSTNYEESLPSALGASANIRGGVYGAQAAHRDFNVGSYDIQHAAIRNTEAFVSSFIFGQFDQYVESIKAMTKG